MLFRSKYRETLFKEFCNNSEAIFVDSKVGKKQVIESYHIAPEKVFELPYIPPPHILFYNSECDLFEKKYTNIPNDFLFYPGQFWKHKNHESLILALASLNEKGKNINLVFAGKKKYEYKNLVDLIKIKNLSNNVFFVDYIPNECLADFYKRARGFIMPTFFGPTNIPPLEATFLGCPSAVSNIYGMKEQLGNRVIYFDPLCIDDIASKMMILWENERVRAELIKNNEFQNSQILIKNFNERFAAIIKSI